MNKNKINTKILYFDNILDNILDNIKKYKENDIDSLTKKFELELFKFKNILIFIKLNTNYKDKPNQEQLNVLNCNIETFVTYIDFLTFCRSYGYYYVSDIPDNKCSFFNAFYKEIIKNKDKSRKETRSITSNL